VVPLASVVYAIAALRRETINLPQRALCTAADSTMEPSPSMWDDLDTSAFGSHRPSPFVDRLMQSTRRQANSWTGRRVAYLLRRLALRRLHGPVDTQALGANLRLYPFSNICEKRILFTPQYFDPQEIELIRSRIGEGFVFIDVGANIGAYALAVAAEAGPTAQVVAVEPQPEIFERLAYNIGQNPFGTIKAVACAIADHNGEVTLFLDNSNRGQSSVKIMSSDYTSSAIAKVPAKTLLALARDERLSRIDAAKLDVEGAEDLILEPFLRDAPRSLWPRLLLVGNVVERWHRDVRKTLTDQGYRLVLETRHNLGFELP
jgi:FkbM family methyltransferase